MSAFRRTLIATVVRFRRDWGYRAVARPLRYAPEASSKRPRSMGLCYHRSARVGSSERRHPPHGGYSRPAQARVGGHRSSIGADSRSNMSPRPPSQWVVLGGVEVRARGHYRDQLISVYSQIAHPLYAVGTPVVLQAIRVSTIIRCVDKAPPCAMSPRAERARARPLRWRAHSARAPLMKPLVQSRRHFAHTRRLVSN